MAENDRVERPALAPADPNNAIRMEPIKSDKINVAVLEPIQRDNITIYLGEKFEKFVAPSAWPLWQDQRSKPSANVRKSDVQKVWEPLSAFPHMDVSRVICDSDQSQRPADRVVCSGVGSLFHV